MLYILKKIAHLFHWSLKGISKSTVKGEMGVQTPKTIPLVAPLFLVYALIIEYNTWALEQ